MKNREARPLNKMEYFCIGENISMLEKICERFPVLCGKILTNLDDKNLVNIKVVSRKLCSLVQNERLLWIRNIKKFISAEHALGIWICGCRFFPKSVNYKISEKWQHVINKAPVQFLKELAIAITYKGT